MSVQHVETYPHHITISSCVYTILSFTVQDGVGPLFMASQEGHTDIVDLLLKAGADVHQARKVFRPEHMLLSTSSMHTYCKGWFCSSDNGCSEWTLPHCARAPEGRSQHQPPGRGEIARTKTAH